MHVKPSKSISVFMLALLNVSVMASLRNLPLVATYGLQSVIFFIAVAFMFLIPCSLVSAELATGWPKEGGIYVWVKEAFGEKAGFFSIWMQWAHNITWYPAILSFVATTLAYIIYPPLSEHKLYILTVVLASFWGMTLLNYFGIKTSSRFSSVGVILGTILPGLFIILLGLSWFFLGRASNIAFSFSGLIPDISGINNLVFLAGLFLAFGGLEVYASYATDVENPKKNYPKAILLAALITFLLVMLGSLSIAIILPSKEISLVAGLIEAFKAFLNAYSLGFLLPILIFALIIGAVAEVNAWIIGPIKGLYAASKHGVLPPIFEKLNKYQTPSYLLLFQGLIVTAACLVFLYMPTIGSAFWILTAISTQSYLIMYIIMFLAAIKLKYSKGNVVRTYEVPGGKIGMVIIAGMGAISSIFGLFVAFIPPASLQVGNTYIYELMLMGSLAIMASIPLIVYKYYKKSH